MPKTLPIYSHGNLPWVYFFNLYHSLNYFLEIYQKLGFNHVFLYDNNDINGEKLEDIISKEKFYKFITIINFRGYRGEYGGPQMSSYYDCYEKNYLIYDWIAFFDVDEYLVFNQRNLTIQQFLDNSRYNNCEIVKINWKVFSDNNQLEYENKPLCERFIEEVNQSHIINKVNKLIIRGNLANFTYKKIINPHIIFKSKYACNSNGIIINNTRCIKPEYKYAYLNHYYTKSIKEYCLKVKRGRAFLKQEFLSIKLKQYYFNYFFRFNKKTKKKIKIFNGEFDTSFK